jgi:hypothetical protein
MNAKDFSLEVGDVKYRRGGSNIDWDGLRMPEILRWSGGI